MRYTYDEIRAMLDATSETWHWRDVDEEAWIATLVIGDTYPTDYPYHDARFIAAAPAIVRQLLEENRQLRDELDQFRDDCDCMARWANSLDRYQDVPRR